MSPAEAAQRIADLRTAVARHDELYHRHSTPEITDFDYDRLKAELAALEKKFPAAAAALGADTPTARVGDDRTEGFARVKHRQAMTTLDNTYDEAELREFCARLAKLCGRDDLAFSVEPKIDGASISLTYEKGKLTRAVTRGDGEEGDDVTVNVKTIANLPHKLRAPADLTEAPVPDLVEIRGEIFLRFAEFARINQAQQEAGLAPYANPRNLASGTLKQLDTADVKSRGLEIVLYGLGACEPADLVDSQAAWHAALAQWGLPTLEHRRNVRGVEAVVSAIHALDALRGTLPYATDGAVVKLDDFELQRLVGYRGEGQSARKLSPRWACAYKFAPERAETRLNAITIQVGRTGVLTPVAELEPVQLAGTTVARATLHNRDEIARKDIRVGDTVYVEKAGEIIPAVIGVNLARRTPECVPYAFPEKCPVCGTAVVQVEGEVAIRCPNADCPAQLTGRLDYVAGRGVLDIEGLGGVVAERLVETGAVADLFDLFRLQASELAKLILSKEKKFLDSGKERKPTELGQKNAERIVSGISKAREQPLERWILAMQIPDVGGATAQDLAKITGSVSAFVDSAVIRDVAELARLLNEIQRNNPSARGNVQKSQEEREGLRLVHERLAQAADAIGVRLVNAGHAKYSELPLYEASPVGESVERTKWEALRQELDSCDERGGDSDASTPSDKADVKRRRDEIRAKLTTLAMEMIERGLAERVKRPARYVSTIIGPVVAGAILEWVASPRGRRFVERLRELEIDPRSRDSNVSGTVLSGKTVVITGSLVTLGRVEAQDLVRKMGGFVTGSVTRKTDLVVAGPGAGSKLEDAKKLGKKVIDENEFLALVGLPSKPTATAIDQQPELL
ncbi:MAG: NAD-dependent DNA ligase LigA [Opitutaceae bacterium]|nr:NAD-dependent DNA ligase LigA [Opitutaceae bacterium]